MGVELMIKVNKDVCIGCENCIDDCLMDNIIMEDGKAKMIREKCVDCGHCIALCPVDAINIDGYDNGEVVEYSRDKFDINGDVLLNFIKFRRSIRNYEEKEVEKEKIKKIIDAGRYSPTGSNRQHISYTVVKEKLPELRELTINKLKELSDAVLDGKTDNLEYDETTLKKYAKSWNHIYKEYQKGNDKLFFHGNTLIVAKGDTRIKPAPRMELGMALSRMELTAYSLGLGGCYIGYFMSAFSQSEEIRNFLEIKDYEEIVSPLVIGYPNIKYIKTAPRKKADVKWL